jgi:LacI family transcriptional regulator
MNFKDRYSVLAVYSLDMCTGREPFAGILDELSNTSHWSLSTVRPGACFTSKELVDEFGEPYDGLILSMPGTDEVMEKIAKSRIPTVLVNITDKRLSVRCDAIANVWIDNADIGRRAAKHLIERGDYKSAGFVHERDNQYYSKDFLFYSVERMMAFRQTMKRDGDCETSVFPDKASPAPLSPKDFFGQLRTWIRALPKPAAVMAASDMCAADVINACKAEGIPVPSQVSVIGVDYDISQHAKCGMSISSVILNLRMVGRQVVRELDFLFKHPKWKGRPHEVLIPAKDVFAGESTARSVSGTRLVNIALEFISANCTKDLSPNDVIAHLGCSRRLAELRFSQVSGTTIHKAINTARLNEVQRRLRHGESVSSIVKSMHFASTKQLYQMYKRHFGHTTRQGYAQQPCASAMKIRQT